MMFFNNKHRPLEDISPLVVPRVSTRAKRLALRLNHKEGKIHLIIPNRCPIEKALGFAWEHEQWILKTLKGLPDPIYFEDGVNLPILGHDKILDIYSCDTLKKTSINLKNNIISVKTNKKDPSTRLIRYFKKLAKTEFLTLASAKADQINKPIKSIHIKDTSSRWGSCTHDGKISLSWRLIFAPIEASDYVIAHEVAHLVHMNHSKRFWQLCTELSTDFSTGKQWIKTHGQSLMRYGATKGST
jgi:predicted metal-dependent hydrolase